MQRARVPTAPCFIGESENLVAKIVSVADLEEQTHTRTCIACVNKSRE
jgi:hypothetical protein